MGLDMYLYAVKEIPYTHETFPIELSWYDEEEEEDGTMYASVWKYMNDGKFESVIDCAQFNTYPTLISAHAHLYSKNGSIEVQNCIGYWRKANAIHSWFVKNVQNDVDDCGHYSVTADQLSHLYLTIENVLASKDGILTPQGGFFFGPTEINDYYWEYLKETEKVLHKLLTHPNISEYTFNYHASW